MAEQAIQCTCHPKQHIPLTPRPIVIFRKVKGKGKVAPVLFNLPRRRIGEWKYSSTHS